MWVYSQSLSTLHRSGLCQALPTLTPTNGSRSPSWHLSTCREDPKGQGCRAGGHALGLEPSLLTVLLSDLGLFPAL